MTNSQKSFTAFALLIALGVMSVFGQNGHNFDVSGIDKNASACTDFYQYANGNWLAKNPIPAPSELGVANVLNERTAMRFTKFSMPRRRILSAKAAANRR